jgi:gas vesicle protein
MVNLIRSTTKPNLSFKFKSLVKAALSFFAVMLLVTTTACNGANSTAKVDPLTNSNNPAPGKVTELYKPIAPAEGGMNNYSDVDPRMDKSEAKAKAERLIDKTGKLQRDGTNPFKQLGKQFDEKGLPERIEDTAKQVNRSAQETSDDVVKGTKRGYSNLKENTNNFTADVKSSLENTQQKAVDRAEDLKDTVRKNS